MSRKTQYTCRHQRVTAETHGITPQEDGKAAAGSVNSSIFITNSVPGSTNSQGIPCGVAHAAVTMAVASQVNVEMYPVYATATGTIKRSDFIEGPKAIKNIRILGLMAVLSYMTVILSVWMYANFGGYVYFLAGEPNLLIKYTEWALGLTGILVTTDLLRKEIKEMA